MARLRAAGIEGAARDVAKLRDAARDGAEFDRFIAARARHQPVAQIIGWRAFWRHDFRVTPDVLDPRPDTETLVEAALAVPFDRVLDLGTGSGCVLISLLSERPEARGLGIDISPAALDVARGNGTRIGIDARVDWAVSDWFAELDERHWDRLSGRLGKNFDGKFDLIVSNPPYIGAATYTALDRGVREFEPKIALTPGPDGLQAFRRITGGAGAVLRDGGWLMVEIGWDQAQPVCGLFEAQGFHQLRVLSDLAGKDRCVIGRLSR